MIHYDVAEGGERACPPALLARIGRALRNAPGCRGRRSVRIGVRFVTASEIQRLNRVFRKRNRVTDVLSFSQREGDAFPRPDRSGEEWGDLVVCPSVAATEAKRRAMRPGEELARLIIHGTLHLAGMDHATPDDEARMFGIQERAVEQVMRRA